MKFFLIIITFVQGIFFSCYYSCPPQSWLSLCSLLWSFFLHVIHSSHEELWSRVRSGTVPTLKTLE